jgi:hypothetical protein
MADNVKRLRLDIADKNFDFLSDEKVRNINFNWTYIYVLVYTNDYALHCDSTT